MIDTVRTKKQAFEIPIHQVVEMDLLPKFWLRSQHKEDWS
jgi:hypothetical protein